MSRIENEAICKACGLDCAKEYGWRPGPVVHCRGAADVLSCFRRTDHHGRKIWHCPRCERHLGCSTCCGRIARFILCLRCQTFADGDVLAGSGLEPIDIFKIKEVVDLDNRLIAGIDRSIPAADRN